MTNGKYILKTYPEGDKIWIDYRLDEDRTHPYWLEHVDENGKWLARMRFRTLKAAYNSYYYSEDYFDD